MRTSAPEHEKQEASSAACACCYLPSLPLPPPPPSPSSLPSSLNSLFLLHLTLAADVESSLRRRAMCCCVSSTSCRKVSCMLFRVRSTPVSYVLIITTKQRNKKPEREREEEQRKQPAHVCFPPRHQPAPNQARRLPFLQPCLPTQISLDVWLCELLP